MQSKYSGSLPAVVDFQKDSGSTGENGTQVKPVLLAVKIFAVCCILYILSTSDVHNIHSKSLSRFTWSNTISKSRQKKQQKLSSEVAHQPQDICWFSLIHCSFCFFRALLTYTVSYLFFTFLYFKYLLIYEKWCTNCKLQIHFQYLRLFFIHKSNCDTFYGVL